MRQAHLAETTFVVAPLEQVATAVRDPTSWQGWAPGLVMEVVEDRGSAGLRWRVRGGVTGTAEVWLEPVLDGVAVHWFLRGAGPPRRLRSVERRYRRAWTRFAFALKDRLEAGREAGVKPVGGAAEE